MTPGLIVPDFRRSPAPMNPSLTMHPMIFPRRRTNRRATRCTITSPWSMLKLMSDSELSSFRTKIAGNSLRAPKVRRVSMPLSEAAMGLSSGFPQYQ